MVDCDNRLAVLWPISAGEVESKVGLDGKRTEHYASEEEAEEKALTAWSILDGGSIWSLRERLTRRRHST